MAVLGDLRSYTMYATGNAIQAAGNAGAGGSPLGFGLGMVLPQILQQQQGTQLPMGIPSQAAGVGVSAPAASAPATPKHLDFSDAKPASVEDVLKQLQRMAQQFGWVLEETDKNVFSAIIPLAAARRQKVYLELDRKDADGNRVLGVWSTCGTINPSAAMTVLRNNDSVVHGAFAIRRMPEGEVLVLRSNLLADLTDAGEMAKIVSAIAWQADQVEQQLSGSADSF